ncbi:MAG TPA: LysR substrate-binding domain-containing protein, partial [Tianweitania sediminis]|nr:LysR substrate-binding domain-containing protein [Tianweitania sediminis]
GALSLAILPAFGTRWLAPRLGRFQSSHPGVTLNLATRLKRFNLDAEGFDAAIHFGTDDWRSADHLKLFDERVTACASPAFLTHNKIHRPEDLLDLPLFQIESRPSAWPVWFEAHGLSGSSGHGMLFDQFAPMTQAAIAGLGVALLPSYLAAPEIAEKRLVALFKEEVAGVGAYWLVWPTHRADYPPLLAFREWLAEQTRPAQ